jgi:hypothetical protein
MSNDYFGTYAEGIKNLDREVSAEVAVITYKTTFQLTSEGKDMSGTYNSVSTWVKTGGKWLEVFHTEVKAQ